MNRRWWGAALAPVLAFAFSAQVANVGLMAAEKAKPAASQAANKAVLTEPVVFDMEEVPAFGPQEPAAGAPVIGFFPHGQSVVCQSTPDSEVKAYPQLKSKRPLYGSLQLDRDPYDAKPSTVRHFVFDEVGQAEKEPAKAEAEKPSLLQSLAKALGVQDSSTADAACPRLLAAKYDRLYFDLNGDRDLTNDGTIPVAEKSVFAGIPNYRESPNVRSFKELALPVDFGPPLGQRPFVLLPRLQVYGPGFGVVQFIPKMARQGKIRFGDQEYIARLIQSGTVSGRYDRPSMQLQVLPADRSSTAPPLLRSGQLGLLRVVNGQLLSTSASPLGDKLTISPYRGDVGVLELGPGGRPITDLGITGLLIGRHMMVPLGDSYYAAAEQLASRHTVPVGDYVLPYLTARYGRLRFSARSVTDAIVEVRGSPPGPQGLKVQIRKQKPFVLAFSGKPEVKFSSPTSNQTFKPGMIVPIRAMLNEPSQGIQITGLWDATHKESTAKVPALVDGKVELVSQPQYTRLDPTIVIRDSAGKEVASGTMPFG